MLYPVNTIYNCVQGEGCLTGTAMTLVRLQGCSVGCHFCDTRETWDLNPENEAHRDRYQTWVDDSKLWRYFSDSNLAAYIVLDFSGPGWVLITGGEPAQYHLTSLVACLHSYHYKVALETSGTETGHLGADFDWVCVSPKLNMSGGKQIIPAVLEAADEIKMVVGKSEHIEQLEGLLGWTNGAEICLQPISQSEKATQLCIDEVIKHGWRLSVQMHKYIGVG